MGYCINQAVIMCSKRSTLHTPRWQGSRRACRNACQFRLKPECLKCKVSQRLGTCTQFGQSYSRDPRSATAMDEECLQRKKGGFTFNSAPAPPDARTSKSRMGQAQNSRTYFRTHACGQL